ncbi:hypothetical protein [Dermacoccus barathri]|uniref:DUF2178 domain-containing protein n=1 Tax=Dermacoccus abyssi TaxID=322596 RepID=A0ABX5Z9K9_9MICO|nr:hypothetical protein [Dermacoccus barathri]MBE7370396.1 hypothetical protein [Dermacoccus barathri]QEH92470.1 hypothetical protein FV141_02145 [Dermacoccus abyssi]
MTTQSTWGTTRSGRSPWPGAIGIGVAVAVVLGLAAWAFASGTNGVVYGIVLAAASFMPGLALGWILVVDRRTVKGAVRNPEESIEAQWYDRATRGTFHDLLVVMGLTAMALSVVPQWRDGLTASDALVACMVFAAADVSARYLLTKRRES